MSDVLHRKYRPATFDDVVGQSTAVDSLIGVIERDASRAIMLSGPSGVGKTTLARIAAYEMGCGERDILEIDAATNTGVDHMRSLQEIIKYKPLSKSSMRAAIVDEAHRISHQAWDSLLKLIEEPPEHAVFFFCTTRADKVPQTIKTRCTHFPLKDVSKSDLEKLLSRVCEAEKIDLEDDIQRVIIKQANSSPRQLLVNLELCRDVSTRQEASEILAAEVESQSTYQLCKFLTTQGSWRKAMQIVDEIESQGIPAESVRISVCAYMSSALRKAADEKQARFFLSVLDAFSEPYADYERLTPLLISIGLVVLPDEEDEDEEYER